MCVCVCVCQWVDERRCWVKPFERTSTADSRAKRYVNRTIIRWTWRCNLVPKLSSPRIRLGRSSPGVHFAFAAARCIVVQSQRLLQRFDWQFYYGGNTSKYDGVWISFIIGGLKRKLNDARYFSPGATLLLLKASVNLVHSWVITV